MLQKNHVGSCLESFTLVLSNSMSAEKVPAEKKNTFASETEDNNSAAVLCADNTKNIPVAYLTKGML